MNILAMQSSGDQTSVSVMLDEEINSFSLTHARKDRPDWDMFLSNVGFKRDFELKDIDLFAFGNSQNSYTATRTIASYMKGIAVALLHPGLVSTRMTGFTANGITTEESVKGLIERIDLLSLENSGSFWHSNGENLPW